MCFSVVCTLIDNDMPPQQILIPVMTHIVNESTVHAKPHFFLFFTTISTSKEMFFSDRELKKALHDTLT